jgi:hypothetical protein
MTKSKIPPKAGKLFILIILLFGSIPTFGQTVDTAWVRRYNGPGSGKDEANKIAIDVSGNVYVAGYSYVDPVSGIDYTTIKYYPNGDTAWVRRYDGPGSGYGDYIYSMVLDNSGNVYVTGASEDIDGYDYATIKYYPNGDTAWVRRYIGTPGISSDGAFGIVLDGSKNICVTGWGYDSSGNYDYLTIKYDPNGNELWTSRYKGPGNSNEWGRAISVDGSDNFYVTGLIYGAVGSDDYCTIKYYPNGDTAWLRRYNGPGNNIDRPEAIAVDGSNNAYVTGRSVGDGTMSDYATIKYYSTGDTAWVRRYNGPGNGTDEAYALVVDNSSNVYVTGRSYSNGVVGFDIVTIKYYTNGDTAWLRRYNGPGNMADHARTIAVDVSGNVYVAGYTEGAYVYANYVTMKYYPNGDMAWVRTYEGPGNWDDQIYSIALDGFGNVFVTGRSYASGTDYDYATIKYYQNYSPTITAPDSTKFLCGTDTIRFTVLAVDPNGDDTLTLSGPGIPIPARGLSPLSAEAKNYVPSAGTYDYVYTVTDSRNASDNDTATYVITFNTSPDSFSLISPLDSALVPYMIAFDWESATDPDPLDQVKYDLYVSTSFSFHVDSTFIYDSLLTSQHTDTLDRGIYYWKVKAYDNCVERWSNQTWTLLSAIRGDANGDGVINVTDVVYLINYLFISGPAPNPIQAGDANCDGVVNVTDVVYLINYLFLVPPGPPPCE